MLARTRQKAAAFHDLLLRVSTKLTEKIRPVVAGVCPEQKARAQALTGTFSHLCLEIPVFAWL
jgi:hypothetical protein